ncbi:uncharacterized protein THITE_2117126 [Thermothielavioides terrestris NRRL 8126]|uniref:Uncharacterized protein n=1 Tax=Thermothielavioides terrestris (strain ATCC 38088 / NRRL 8126) TaxID=578455 RepID=G2R7N5_THETT|nr:uncharacterized protein THITE_2117126 [Thermothielavioides terrestris NRRL 8126]AEO67944.1 hypothetical protein THITE_2117126 [Thermothielavioides terrestris NRRL 8126]
MGNESSRPEGHPARSRSLSPLPRDEMSPYEGDDDDTRPVPSSMPASLATADPRLRLPSGADPPPGGRGRRQPRQPRESSSESSNPSDPGASSDSSEPGDPGVDSSGSSDSGEPPSPSPSSSSSSTKNRLLPARQPRRVRTAPRQKATVTLTQPQEPLGEPEPDAVASFGGKPSKKGKGKAKEMPETTAVASPSRTDAGDESPPSAQPLTSHGRRNSGSEARKKPRRRHSSPDEEGVDGRLKAEPPDEDGLDRTLPEHVAGGLQSAATVPSQSLPYPSSQRSHSDSGYAEPDVPPKSAPEREMNPALSGGLDALPHAGDDGASAEDDQPPASTLPTSSGGSPGSRQITKRKTKRPFFSQEEEENARALSELPPDGAVSPPEPRRSRRLRVTAQGKARPPTASRGVKKQKTPERQADVDTSGADSDDEEQTEKPQYQSGPLSDAEKSRINRVVERFLEDEGMTQQELNQLIQENPQTSAHPATRQFWSSIQEACPSRRRRKLIHWCRQHFHNFAGRGTWTQEQDNELAELVEAHGKKWSHIAGLINRHPMDVRDRWRNYLVCRGNNRTDPWSEDEEERFREVVETAIEKIRERLDEASGKSPEDLINWLTISEAMGHTRTRLQCMEKWKRMRASEPVPDEVPTVLPPGSSWRLEKARKELRSFTAAEKYALVRAIRDSGVGTDAKIPWKQIIHRTFDGNYERQSLMVTWGRLKQTVPDREWKTTRDCAGYLCDMYEEEGNFAPLNRREAEEDVIKETPKSTKKQRRKGKAAASSPSGSKKKSRQTEPDPSPELGAEPSDAGPDDVVTEAQVHPEYASLVAGQSHRAARAPSPELGANPPEPSPTVEAQAARTKRRERRASLVASTNSNEGKGKGQEVPVSPPQPASQTGNAKASKRTRRGSIGVEDSPRHKKQKTNKASSANVAKVNRAKAVSAEKGVGEGARMPGRPSSVISSDSDDDMEDIPATLPWSSSNRAAR